MIEEFIGFVCELFPSINPYTKEKVNEAIRQFDLQSKKTNFFLNNSLDHLAQGDIVKELPFSFYTSNGERRTIKAPGLLLSNTCDAENDKTISFAPLIPIKNFSGNQTAIKKNQTYRLLYFPDHQFEDYVVDFGLVNSYSTKLINTGIECGKINKKASLSDLGYYLFLCKLTVHFMRPEDTGVQYIRRQVATA